MEKLTGSHRRSADRSAPTAGRRTWLSATILSACLIGTGIGQSWAQAVSNEATPERASACATYGGWIDVKDGRSIDRADLFSDLAAKHEVVLLGESHTDVDHHLWQLHTLAELYGRGEHLVMGFEAFPRRLQPVLNDWVDGKLSEEAFLKASEWRQVWGYDAALYMPLFQFARLNRVPMIALNVERKLVSQVGQKGWEEVPVAEREGLSNPAPVNPAYERDLARVYAMKKTMPPEAADRLLSGQGSGLKEPDEAAVTEAMKEPEFKRFVEAQLTWDRAMAEALVSAKRKSTNTTVVGILGSGHVADGHGVPDQLRALGISEQKTFIPVSVDTACTLVGTAYADAVFTLPREDETPPPERPRLGVLLSEDKGALRINRVVGNSVAEIAGIKAGDEVVRAAGLETRRPDELVEIVSRQAPGTWLPLTIKRDGQEIDVIAKFPTRPKTDR